MNEAWIHVEFYDGPCRYAWRKNIIIGISETPPCPNGMPILIFEDDYDPCNDENTVYVEFNTDNPYENGITTISPNTIIQRPHHPNSNEAVEIEVCNINLCSEEECCVSYELFLPAPCFSSFPPQYFTGSENNSIETRKNEVGEYKVGISERNKDLLVFPNPSTGQFNIYMNLETSNLVSCEIYNLQGKLMHVTDYKGTVGDHVIPIELSNKLNAGIYLLKVAIGKKHIANRKIVVY